MNALQKEAEILFKLKQKVQGTFVIDGMISWEKFLSKKPSLKVVFIFKEPIRKVQSEKVYKNIVGKGKEGSYWNNVTRWVKGIQSLPKLIPWEKLTRINKEHQKKWLSTIGFIHLKKTYTSHNTFPQQIKNFAEQHREQLREQLQHYSSYTDLFISCGSKIGQILKDLQLLPINDWQKTTNGTPVCQLSKGQYLIQHYSPRSRIPNRLLHYPLMGAVQKLVHH